MTVDGLLTDDHLAYLSDADERGVDIHIAGISESVQTRIQEAVPSAELFETLWKWADTPAGTLLITDQATIDELVADHDREPLQTELHHRHLPKLEDAGYVNWTPDSQTVRRGPRFDDIEPVLGLLYTHQDDLPDELP